MVLGEMILTRLSADPEKFLMARRQHGRSKSPNLEILEREFDSLHQLIRGKRVVDFGCGRGLQTLAMLDKGVEFVCGVDTNTATLAAAKSFALDLSADSSKYEFVEKVSPDLYGTFDVVISQDAMEHFASPQIILREMKKLIKPTGKLVITFGPPWYAPYGSHMHFFCKVPWLNLLFSEKTIMAVRSRYIQDGARKFEDVESGLNKMSVGKFEQVVSSCGLDFELQKYTCIKQLNWLSKIPILRELFVNQVTCILTPVAQQEHSTNSDTAPLKAEALKDAYGTDFAVTGKQAEGD